ncbi:HAD family hydrolase [Hymenobacter nivis]|uniref:HAD family hydrolase n=1 Tax=Hymenobacter nivis TaxID=1850093 RepID=A0A502HF68_9BACT|nr:HAD-IA family hydrolase [Hymenobacter nivis]TPG72086.1 HAD family hydrolase [Hymenobacter nivis]
MIQTVIFDMDGVIIDTEPIHHHAFFTQFAELGITVSDAQYASYLGSSTRNVFQQLKEQFGLPQEIDALLLRKRELFNQRFDNDPDLDLLDNVRGLLDDLRAHQVPLVLASSASKATIGRVFKRFGLGPYFGHIVSGEDFAHSKPDPAIFLHAAALAETPVSECVVIEDSANGVAAAKAAGIYCIGYASPHSAGQDLHQANMIIQHFSELSAEKIRAIQVG